MFCTFFFSQECSLSKQEKRLHIPHLDPLHSHEPSPPWGTSGLYIAREMSGHFKIVNNQRRKEWGVKETLIASGQPRPLTSSEWRRNPLYALVQERPTSPLNIPQAARATTIILAFQT